MSDVYAPRPSRPRVTPRSTGRTANPGGSALRRAQERRDAALSGSSQRGQRSASLAAAARDAQAKQEAGRAAADRLMQHFEREDTSFLGQVGNEVQAAVTQGPAQILKAGIGTTLGPIRAAVDLVKDGELRGDGGWHGAFKEYQPLPAAMSDSLENTARFAMDPVDTWREAADENRTASLLFETVGNAALVGGALSKVIGRAPRVVPVANPTEALIARGSTRATPRTLSAGGSANAQRRGVMMTPARETARSARRASVAGQVADVATVPVAPRGTGLAGYARRAGMDNVADRLNTVGQTVGRATRVLDAPDNLTVGMQLMGAGKLAGAAGRAGMRLATRVAPAVNRVAGADNVINQLVDPDARARRDIADEIMAARDGERIAISRESAAVLKVADDEGLSRAQEMALLNSIDNRYDDLADAVEQLDEAAGRELVAQRFADRPEQMRPTYEGIQAIIDYRRDADPKVAQAIVDVSTMLERMVGQRTERALDSTVRPLNPEQLGDEMLTPAVDKVRGKLERKRDAALKMRDQVHTRTVRAEAVDRAQAAVNATIPEVNSRALIEQGKVAGIAIQQLRQLRQDHRRSQTDLGVAVDAYMRAVRTDGPNSTAVQRLQRQLDELTDETVALEQRVRDQQRQIDAARGLAAATGEVETVDADGNPVDPQQAIQREIAEIAQRPEPDLTNMTTTDAIETTAREVVDEIRAEIHNEIDTMTAGERPRIPGPDDWVNAAGDPRNGEWAKRNPKEARRPGQFDWYESLSANQKRNLVKDGWLAGADRPNMASPDDFTRIVNAQTGRDLSIDQAIDAYLELVEQARELRVRGAETRTRRSKRKVPKINEATGEAEWYGPPRRTTSDPVPTRVVETVADRMNVSPEVVRAALDGGPKAERTAALKAAFSDDVRRGYEEVKAAWDSIEPEMKASIYQTAREIAEEGGDLFEYIMDVAENYGMDSREAIAMYGATDAPSLWMWLEGADPVVPETFVRAVTDTPGPAQKRLIARMQATLKASKAALRERYSEQRSLRKIYDSVRDDADARVEDAAGRVDVAEIQVDAAAARLEDHVTNRPRLDETAAVTPRTLDGWRRRRVVVDAMTGEVKEYPSRFEADRVREGRANGYAAMTNRNRSIQIRRAQSYNDRIANLPTELGRSAQLRLVEDVNAPAVRGFFGTVRKAGAPLGNVVPKLGDVPAQLTGLMDRVVNQLAGREASFRVAAMMDSWGPFDSVDARYNAFLDALDEEGIVIAEGTDAHRNLRDSMMAERAIEAMNTAQQAAGGSNLNLPYRVRDAARRATQGFPQEMRNQLEAQFARYEQRRNKHLRSTFDDYLAVMPKRFREVARENIANVRTYLDMAEKAIADGDTYLAELLHRMAQDAPTTLEAMREQGIDPRHLVGGKPETAASGVRNAAGAGGIGRTVTRGSKQSRSGGRPETLADYMRLEAAEQITQVNADTLSFLQNHPGLTRRADAIVGEFIDDYTRDNRGNPPNADAILAALDEQGWAPLPKSPGPIHRGTAVVPKIALKAMQADSMAGRAWPWRALAMGNRIFKYSVLAASPLWQIGNVVGNIFMASLGMGKMSVLDMPRLYRQSIQQSGGLKAFWGQGGLASWAPDELASHGLSFGEHELIRRAWDEKGSINPSKFKSIVSGAYRLNEFMDNSFRSIMYADQMQKMANDPTSPGRLAVENTTASEAAVKHTLRALGDFTNMTAFEKRYVREVFPFWAWIRHQTLMTMRMPLYSPMRTAYLLALTDALEDEDFANEFYEMVGARIPLGGGNYLNLGNISPFSTPWDLPLPTNLPAVASAISPAVRMPVQAITGFDVGRLRNTTRPYDERPVGPYGSTPPAAPPLRGLAGLGEMAYVAAGALPQTKAARDIVLGTGTARYGSGQRVGTGEYDDDTSALDAILAGARVPRPENMEDRLYDLTQQMLERQGR